MNSPSLKELWAQGKAAVGAWCMIPSTISAEAVARAGFDFVCVDVQHGMVDYQTTLAMLQVIDLAPTSPLVRAPWNEPAMIGKLLDAGAMGVIVPLVNSPEEAEAAVAACKYPPQGRRSFGPIRVAMREGPAYYERANRDIAVIPMIETAAAVDAVEEIVAVPGVDAVYIGPADLALSYGLSPGYHHDEPRYAAALERVLASCAKAGVVPGIHSTGEHARRHLDMGFRVMSVTMDLEAMGVGIRADLERTGTR